MFWTPWVMALALCVQEQEAKPLVFHVYVDAVQLDIFVGRGAKAVLGLTADDFEVYDNGVLQRVESLKTGTEPLAAILVFDTSWSVQGGKLEHLQQAARAFLGGLESTDQAALICFSTNLRLSHGLSASGAVMEAVAGLQPFGSTSLYDGLYAGLKLAETVERPLVLLFTDGVDTFSWLTSLEVSRVVEESHAVIYVVSTTEKETSVTWKNESDTEFLRRAATWSGGRFLYAESSARLEGVFQQILDEMKTRYLISYVPAGVAEGGWHELDVRVKDRRLGVIAPKGYWRRRKR